MMFDVANKFSTCVNGGELFILPTPGLVAPIIPAAPIPAIFMVWFGAKLLEFPAKFIVWFAAKLLEL